MSTRFPIDLSTARTDEPLNIGVGNLISVEMSDPTGIVYIAIDRPGAGRRRRMRQNGKLETRKDFNNVYITNTAQAGVTCSIVIDSTNDVVMYDDPEPPGDINTIINPVTVTGGQSATHAVETVGTSAVQVVTASSSTTAYLLQADHDNTDDIYLAPANTVTADAAATGGIRLKPGDALPGTGRHDMYARSGTAGQKLRKLVEAV